MRFRTGKQHIAWPGVARVTEGMRTDVYAENHLLSMVRTGAGMPLSESLQ